MPERTWRRVRTLVLVFLATACSDATDTAPPATTRPPAPTMAAPPSVPRPPSPTVSSTIPEPWQALARPLQFVTSSGATCVTATSEVIGKNRALGGGPVRIASGGLREPPTFPAFPDPEAPNRLLIKPYWLRDPSLRSPVLIRGMNLASGTLVLFESTRAWRVLDPPTGAVGTEWSIGADVVIIDGRGCYGFQFDTEEATTTVVIEVV